MENQNVNTTDQTTATSTTVEATATVIDAPAVDISGGVQTDISTTEDPTPSGIDGTESFFVHVKTLLIIAGHDIDDAWDDALAYSKKIMADEPLSVEGLGKVAETLGKVLAVAGHEVEYVMKDAFDFARNHGK